MSFFWVVLTGLITWLVISPEKFHQAIAYYYASFLNLVGQKHTFTLPFHGKNYQQNVETILHYPYYKENADHMVNLFGKSSLAAFVFSFVLGLCFAFYFIHRGKAQRANQFIRGSRIDTKENVIQQILDKKNYLIAIDGFPSKRTAKFNICWCMELSVLEKVSSL
ncbi:TraD N-terminal domain-containing protein [Legionella pneumophila]|nr:TraD N-terminal domain-containing protein [Legionella pneumophila]